MEFLEYANAAPVLTKQGIVAQQDGDALRLSIKDEKGVTRRMVIGKAETAETADESVRKIEAARDDLAEIAESIVHRLHLSEAVLIPVARWQDILDVTAFDLATDEGWLEIDAEATLHQKGRDPLVLLPNDRHLIKTIVAAILTHGESDKHDLFVTSLDSPFIMRLRHTGSLSVWCANAAVADMIRGVAKL